MAVKVAIYRTVRTCARLPPPTAWVPGALATVTVVRGYADEGCVLAVVQLAQLGQFGEKTARHSRP